MGVEKISEDEEDEDDEEDEAYEEEDDEEAEDEHDGQLLKALAKIVKEAQNQGPKGLTEKLIELVRQQEQGGKYKKGKGKGKEKRKKGNNSNGPRVPRGRTE